LRGARERWKTFDLLPRLKIGLGTDEFIKLKEQA
jgi:hypothetical protein